MVGDYTVTATGYNEEGLLELSNKEYSAMMRGAAFEPDATVPRAVITSHEAHTTASWVHVTDKPTYNGELSSPRSIRPDLQYRLLC